MNNRKVRLVILRNEDARDYHSWESACKAYPADVEYRVVDLTANDWLEKIRESEVDYLLAKPGGKTSLFRQMYEERISILAGSLGYKVFPTLDEIRIYENKRYLSYWLKANQLKHPRTDVFFFKPEAINFVKSATLPLVGKINVGASGSGVKILRTVDEAKAYIEKAFTTGIVNRTGPKLEKGKLVQRAWRKFTHPGELRARLSTYKAVAGDAQKGFVIFQEFIPHDFEWRVVRIGDSFFAHKKLKVKDKASGTLLKGYENPPLKLLDFVKDMTDKYHLYSQAVDIFESPGGEYYLNEIQCIFGQSDPYQMLVDGKKGRYIWKKDGWHFEEGDFNQNQSYNLRVEYVIHAVRNTE